MDIMSWLQLNELRTPSEDDISSPRDIFFSSKGHDAPALYSTFIGLGKLDFNLIHKLRRLDGLPGHPDVATPNIITNTGSLGMGVSKAKGMIFANRLRNREGTVFVLTGDGELQEGQFWESLISAANKKLYELTVIIDHNKLQSDTLVSKVSDLADLEAKLAAFGWNVSRCDGNDLTEFSKTLEATRIVKDKPKVIIADTIKGKGVSFMEHSAIDSDIDYYKFHSGAPSEDLYVRAAQELIDTANALLHSVDAAPLEIETVIRPGSLLPENPQRLIPAYSNALLDQARRNANIVALDADLILDTGLIPFQKEFPDRFVECGIAEQDMVSQAGGMALQGLLPVVHSFACFLSTRPNEQIYNNATEHTKIIYVGSLAGLLPGGPGHSHQAVRDISALGAIPELVMMEPSCEMEVSALLDWCIQHSQTSSYIRLNSLPWIINYEHPAMQTPALGRGQVLMEGTQIAIISHGPAMMTSALSAAEFIKESNGMRIKIINLPWLNCIDGIWLESVLQDCKLVVCIEDHYEIGGQADFIEKTLHSSGVINKKFFRMGLNRVPSCGTNVEVLERESLDGKSIAQALLTMQSELYAR